MVESSLNLRHLRAFYEVGAIGKLSQAAEAIHLSGPAVTQAIAKLEQLAKQKLFFRRPSGMFLTDAGKLFHNRTKRALAFIETGARRAYSERQPKTPVSDKSFYQRITSTQLRALIAIERYGSYSRAAREIGTSQPSLHRSARDLERASGLELFIKTPRGIELSNSAYVLARYSRLAFSELRQGLHELLAMGGTDTSSIIIGTLPLAKSMILPTAINNITRENPKLTIKVIDGPYLDLLKALRHGELDLIIGALRNPAPYEDVLEEKLFDEDLSVVARKDHPLAKSKQISPKDLLKFPWVVPRPGTPTRNHFDKLIAKSNDIGNVQIVESSSLIFIRGLLLGSDRLTLLSRHQIQSEIIQDVFCCLNITLKDTERPIGLTTRRDWQPTSIQKSIINLLKAAV